MIRNVAIDDARQVCAIYNPYVTDSIITFEEREVTVEEMAAKISEISQKFPWLVFEEKGTIHGYAYAAAWKARSAYRFSVETTIYLDRESKGRGIGKSMYRELISRLGDLGFHRAYGGIALPNEASVALHERLGFVKVAHLREVGFKFGNWIDVGYWELNL